MTAVAGVRLTITSELAEAVGRIARDNPGEAIEIRHHDDKPDNLWLVLVHHHDGRPARGAFHGYLVDDESGIRVEAHNDTLEAWLR